MIKKLVQDFKNIFNYSGAVEVFFSPVASKSYRRTH